MRTLAAWRGAGPGTGLAVGLAAGLAGCSGGGPTTPLLGTDRPPELVVCQSRIGDEQRHSRILLRTARNLGSGRVADRAGREMHVRVHPDGERIVFARQRRSGDEGSRELFTALRDNSEAELRLTVNAAADDAPTWSPDGRLLLFSSDRGGERRLWHMAADGDNPREFLAGAPGTEDRDPDWHGPTDRIVFSRAAGGGPFRLFLVQGNGTGLTPLTDGGGAGAGLGDREGAFSPDGSEVAFARRTGAETGVLMVVEAATGVERLLLDPMGEARRPRWSPHGDRLFAALSRPDAGRPGLRLHQLLPDGTEPLLVIPDERFRYDGFDALDDLPALPAADPTPRPVDLARSELQLAAGSAVRGGHRQLETRDGDELLIRTVPFGNRQVAGLNLKMPLPVENAEDVLQSRITVVAGLDRVDRESVLRLAVHNAVENRADTVVERIPPDTGAQELAFSMSSLAHVSRERELRLEVIGDLDAGDPSVLRIDQVRILIQVRATGPR